MSVLLLRVPRASHVVFQLFRPVRQGVIVIYSRTHPHTVWILVASIIGSPDSE